MVQRLSVHSSRGGRKTSKRVTLNLFVVWFCTGFWHGANWTFIAWGLYFFVFISIEKYTNFENKGLNSKLANTFKHIYLLVLILFGWVLFRSETFGFAMEYIQSMLGLNGNAIFEPMTVFYIKEYAVFVVAAIIFAMPVAQKIRHMYENYIVNRKNSKIIIYILEFSYLSGYILLFLYSIAQVVVGSYSPFIYFNF